MSQFIKEIDLEDNKEIARFLADHFKYYTMNSWNRSKSYAHNMKIHNIETTPDIQNKLYELIQSEEFYDEIRMLIDDFGRDHNFRYQAGFNGRSGGYLVLYNGGTKPSGYKSYCPICGQRNYQEATETNNRCGKCGNNSRINYTKELMTVYTQPGLGLDDDDTFDDFMEWDTHSLKERAKIVMEFDRLAEDIKELAISLCENYDIKEETYFVPKTRMVLVEKERKESTDE